jgi:Flp pilus assembly protein TadG
MRNINFNKQKGASAVEFALILTPLFVLVFAIFQFGILFNHWIAITQAAREGARLAAVDEDQSVIEEAIESGAPSVDISTISITGLHGEVGTPVTVTVTGWPVNLNIPFLNPRSIPISSSATLRIEYKQP